MSLDAGAGDMESTWVLCPIPRPAQTVQHSPASATSIKVKPPRSLTLIWGFPTMGVPQNGWFLRENHIQMDDFFGPPFQESSSELSQFGAIEVKYPGRQNASRRWCTPWSMPREHHQHSYSWPSTPHWLPAAFYSFHQSLKKVGVTEGSKIRDSYNSWYSLLVAYTLSIPFYACHQDTN